MAQKIAIQESPRNGIKFDRVPANVAWLLSHAIGSDAHKRKTILADYAATLDCVYEMADGISTGNGVPPLRAIEQVLRDQGWNILPTHKAVIADMLK